MLKWISYVTIFLEEPQMNHLKPSRPFRIMASIATIALLFGCNNGDSAQKQKEIELKEREIAREKQDWHTSDLLRNEIGALGYELKDTDGGQKVRKM